VRNIGLLANNCNAHLDGKLELVIELGDEHVVTERLPHLHDAYDGGIHLVLAVLEHLLRRRLLLLLLKHQRRGQSMKQPGFRSPIYTY
jgi:hypothetical protein